MAVYTTQAAIEKRLSANGVTLRTDDMPAGAITEAIDDASRQIDEHCLLAYESAQLEASAWVEHYCTDIAVCNVCEFRGNPAPASIVARCEKALARLEKVRLGTLKIPDVPARKSFVPVLSNVRTQLTPVMHTRVQRSRSTGTPAGYAQKVDRYDILDYTI